MKNIITKLFPNQPRIMSDQEYNRVNTEIQKRINMIFSHGFTLISTIAIFLTLTMTLLGISIGEAKIFMLNDRYQNMWKLLFLGGFMTMLFAVPSFLVLPFAVKNHDNLREISNLSAYVKVFYDLPSLLGKRMIAKNEKAIVCSAWETIHCEVDIPNVKLFNIEYKIITILSILFSITLGIAIISWFGIAIYQYGKWNILWMIIYSVIFGITISMAIFFAIFTFKYSSTTTSMAVYLKIYQQKYLRDAVDFGIITKEDYDYYMEWEKTMKKRDENLRKTYMKIEQQKRRHYHELRSSEELIKDVFDYEVAHILQTLDIHDHKGTLARMYRGEKFDQNDEAYKMLLKKSEDLCAEYTYLCGILNLTKKQRARKDEILNILFPNHGFLYGVGAGIHVVAGMVELGNNIYINCNVCFNPTVHIQTGDYFLCAPNVTFGDKKITNIVQDILIGDDVWIGADAKITGDVKIGNGCVIAMGTRVPAKTQLDSMTVYGGNPAFPLHKIEKPMNNEEIAPKLFSENLEFYKHFYQSLKIVKANDNSTEFENFLCGQNYNSLNAFIGAINTYSHTICATYMNADSEKRKSMMSKLFPIMGINCIVGQNLQLEAVGSVILGDNVQIGNNVTLMGNIKIGNNCKIDDNVSIIAIGHDVYYSNRHVTEMDCGPYLKNTSGYVIVNDGIHIHSGAKILANQVIEKDVESNILLLKENKKIIL